MYMDNVLINVRVANCQKKRSATLMMNKLANINSDFIALTEPHIGHNKKATFQSPWNVHCMESNSRAVLVSPPWADAFELVEFSDRDAIFCLVNTRDFEAVIGVIYVENGDLNDNIWIPRLKALKTISPNVLIFADSNAHSVLWGYSRSNAKGKKWEEILANANYEVFTDDYSTTFCNSRGFNSCIDIAFGTPPMRPKISDRINNIAPIGSDHIPWCVQIKSEPCHYDKPQLKLNSADWDRVNNVLNQKLLNFQIPDVGDSIHMEEVVSNFTVIMQESISETIEKSWKKPKQRWWTPELTRITEAIQNENNATTKSNLIKELENKILENKANEWKLFAKNCSSVSDAFLKNKILNLEKQDHFLHPIRKTDGSMTVSGRETADVLLQNWFKLDREAVLNDHLINLEQEMKDRFPINDPYDFPEISPSEIFEAISCLKPLSAPGLDGVPAIFLQKTAASLVPYLVKIYNWCLMLGYTPASWKEGSVILIPKGKIQQGTTKDYRPITLLPIVVKVLEKIILKRFQRLDSINKWISTAQYGFQPGRSTSHALINYSTLISSKLKEKIPTIGLHLDIEGAFNSVWNPILMKRLRELDCPTYLQNWCFNYMCNRKIRYNSPSFSTYVDVDKSTPQGGSLSPFFWCIIIDPIVKIIEKYAEVIMFADDVGIIISGNSWSNVSHKANKILSEAVKWAKNNALVFNPEKSEYIVYTWSKKVDTIPDIKMYGVNLLRSNKIKYLGVYFTEKLQWRAHLNYVAAKATRNLFKLSAIINRVWGIQGHYLKILYTGAIEPILLYACPVWAGAINKKSLLKPLIRVQRIALGFITRTNKKAHLQDSLMLGGISPLECRAKEIALRWWAGTISDIENPCKIAMDELELHHGHGSHFSSVQQLEAWYKQMNIDRSKIEQEHSRIKTQLKRPTPPIIFEEPSDNINNKQIKIEYYTDGSKSDEGVGMAYTRWVNGKLSSSWGAPLDSSCTVFKAELLAISSALDNVYELNEDHVLITTDSLSSLNALKRPSRNRTIENIRLKLIRIERQKTIRLNWTRAHVGNMGNECTDLLAKKISKMRPQNLKMPLDKIELIRLTKSQSMGEWQLLWESRRQKWSFQWKGKVNKKMRLEKFSNQEIELLNNFFAGSIAFNDKKHLWGLCNSPNCDSDPGFRETPRHFLFSCSDTVNLRDELKDIIDSEQGFRCLTFHSIWKSDQCLRLIAKALKLKMSL